jgi:FixJ family two-component response regulator
MVTETVVSLLENVKAYVAMGASSFDAAMAHLSDRGSVDVLVSDYRLWKARSGLELCEAAVALNPAIAIVLISAESPDEVTSGLQRAIFLQKPFGKVDLLHAIEAAVAKLSEAQQTGC